MSPSNRPTYTQAQLEEYFDYINLPNNTRSLLRSTTPSDQLAALTILTRYQLCHVPFENFDLHYAPVKGISLNTSHLFDKVVQRKAGRGGYCMQNNNFFGTVLRTLGFKVMSAGARVAANFGSPAAGNEDPDEVEYVGFTHQVNIVTIDGKKYFVDVGFGSRGPTSPVPLIDGFEAVHTGTASSPATSLKLTHGIIGNNTSRGPDQYVWRFYGKDGPAPDTSKPWLPIYCFGEAEFMPRDFEISSAWVSTSRSSIFVNMIMFQKFLMGEDGEVLIGDLTMAGGSIKERRWAEQKTLRDCKDEEERVQGMEEYLGVKLSLGEKEGIKGYHTELK